MGRPGHPAARLARRARRWRTAAFIAIGAIVGTVAGALSGQPSIGLLGGFAAGVAIAIVIWLRDRRR